MNPSIPASGRQAAREVAGWVPPAARIGYAAKGIVYVLIGFIAFKAATAAGNPEGATGALAELRDEGGGRIMLALIALGLLCHVVWRLVQAALDPEHPERDAKRIGMRLFYLLSAIVYGSLAYTAWQLGRGSGGGGEGDGQRVWIAKLLEMPAGTWLVMAAGIGVIAYGLHQIAKGVRGDVNKRMARGNETLTTIGRVGTTARGLVLLPIGWFVFRAGRFYRASESVDTGEVLRMLGQGWLLAAVGLGLLAYGLHQIGKALFRRIEEPA